MQMYIFYYRNNVPSVFVNMIRGQMMHLDSAFLPLISNICWTSLTIPQVLKDVESVLDRIEMFCKEVRLFARENYLGRKIFYTLCV